MNQDLRNYIESERAKGLSDDAIQSVLINIGYDKNVVDAAFREMSAGQPAPALFHAAPPGPAAPPPFEPHPVPLPTRAAVPGTGADGNAVSAPTTDDAAPGKRRNRIFIRAGIAAAILILCGAAGAAAYFYLGSTPTLTPDQAMTAMLGKMSSLQTFNYRLKMQTDVQSSDAEASGPLGTGSGTYSIEAVGAADFPKAFQSTATLGLSTPELQGSAVIEMRMVNNTFFLQLTSMSQLGLAAAFLGPFQGQWISIDLSQASSTASEFGVQTPKLDAAKLAEIKQAFLDHMPFVITTELPQEKIDDVPAYHYAFRLDEDRLVALQTRIAEITGSPVSEADLRATTKELFSGASDMKGELWIGKKDLLLRKITFNGPYRVTVGTSTVPAAAGTSSFVLTLGGFNQPVAVAVPSGAKSLQTILEGFFGKFSGAAPGSGAISTSTAGAVTPPAPVVPGGPR